MRKISQNIATSFFAGKPLHIDNTYTDGEKVYLHSNLIAKKIHPDKLEISLAGYPTMTTRERLNSILNVFGFDHYIQQKEGKQYIVNEPADSKHIIPEDKFIENFQSLRDRDIVRCISSHENCGAAREDIKRILLNTDKVDIPVDIVEKILSLLPQRIIEEHAKLFSKTLSIKLNIPDDHIPDEHMERLSTIHKEKIVYIDLIGGTDPDMAFGFRKMELPNGFILHPFLSNWENIYNRIEINLNIVFSAHGRGAHFDKENPFFIVLIDHPVYQIIEKNPEIPQEIQDRIVKLGLEGRVLIHKVTPNIRFDSN